MVADLSNVVGLLSYLIDFKPAFIASWLTSDFFSKIEFSSSSSSYRVADIEGLASEFLFKILDDGLDLKIGFCGLSHYGISGSEVI